MSIERSSAPAQPKTVAGAEKQNGKGKVKSGEEADATAGGGFFAILTSLDAPVESSGEADASVGADDKTQIAVLPVVDPVISLTPSFPTDLAMMLEQAGKVAGGKLSVANGTDKPEKLAIASSLLGIEKSGNFKQNVDGALDQVAQASPGLPHKAKNGDPLSGAAAESRAVKFSTLMDVSTKEPNLSGALVSSGMGDSLVRQVEKTAGKSSALSPGYGIDGAWGQNTSSAGSHTDVPSVAVDPSMLSPEAAVAVADTVNYWVTQGVQNAQLKLDGFGSDPVEVSISLKGDEAHIDFRTDQPEVRQILESAQEHLKDLLSNEGLVLSGVSVSASGQEGAGAQEQQRSRPSMRQTTIVTPEAVPAVTRQRANPAVGKALDLFV
ncbi:MAG: flagellar hook-length control protein FliK [Pseudomonadota bacterium]